MSKLTLLAAAGVGYVLGARAGRERYDQIAAGAQKFARNPTVKSAAGKAQDTVAQQAPVVANAVKDKAAAAASTVQDKLHRDEATTAPTPGTPSTPPTPIPSPTTGTPPTTTFPAPATAPPLS